MINAILLGILAAGVAMSFGDTQYYERWYIFALFLTFAYGFKEVAPRLGLAAAITFVYLVANGLWVWVWPNNRFLPIPQLDQMAIRYYAADAVAKLFMTTAVFLVLSKKDEFLVAGRKLVLWFLLANFAMLAVHAFIQWYVNGGGICSVKNSCGGIMRNPSMNAGFMAALLPVALHGLSRRMKGLITVCTLISVIISHSSIGIGMFAVAMALWAFELSSYKMKALAFCGAVWSALAGAIFMSYGPKTFFHMGMRDVMWDFFMGKWMGVATNIRTGLGFGTFGVFGKNAQHFFEDSPNKTYEWPWMHNDWLEIIFDSGLVGGFLVAVVYLLALYGLRRKGLIAEFYSLLLVGALASVNYPSHLAFSAAFGAWLLVLGLLKSNDQEGGAWRFWLLSKTIQIYCTLRLLRSSLYSKLGLERRLE